MLNFKELSQQLLFERRDSDIKKCCVLFNISERMGSKLSKLCDLIDENDLHTYGKEKEPHVTGLYGILPSPNALNETQRVLQKFNRPKIKAKLGECSLFQNDEFDVLKFDVLSQDLHDVNNLLSQNLDFENDYEDYHPHMTVAYLQPGCGQKYVDRIKDKLKGFPLEFGSPIFSDENQTHHELILGYPDNADARFPETGEMNEDIGYGAGFGGGAPYMSGHMGVYNSPDVKQPNSFQSYKKYNMMNNNTVVTSGYYDTVFDADVKKVAGLLKKLGFEVSLPSNDTDDSYSVRGMKRLDQTHTMTNQSSVVNPDDVMNDDSGINLSSETILKYLNQEMGQDDFKKLADAQEEPITYDEIVMGLREIMRQMKYPDKDFATLEVIKQLAKDPKFYSSLGKYDIKENNFRTIKGTNMKADCNVNTKELGSIVRNMLAEKNQTGRQAFSMMSENINNLEVALKFMQSAAESIDQAHAIVSGIGKDRFAIRKLDEIYKEITSLREDLAEN